MPFRTSLEMNTRSFRAAAATVVLMCAIDVHSARAEWSVTGGLGAAHTRESSIRLIQPRDATDVTVSPVVYRAASFKAPIYYGYRLGYFPRSRWIGVEGKFIHLKVIADTSRQALFSGTINGAAVSETRPIASFVQRFSFSSTANVRSHVRGLRTKSQRTGSLRVPSLTCLKSLASPMRLRMMATVSTARRREVRRTGASRPR